MSKMSNSEYNDYKRLIQDRFQYGSGTKEELQRLYDMIIGRYDDGAECLKMLDKYQTKWTMNLH